MSWHPGLAGPVAVAVACFAPVAALAQAPAAVNARVEIAAAVAGSNATLEAIERQANALNRAQQQQIAALQARLTEAETLGAAEVARLQAELIDAREALVADLASRDTAYAEEIAVFRREVTDIASTPEGAAALARYNAGDRVGALAILDRIAAAENMADQLAAERVQVQANRRNAARLRSNAVLALDARGKSDRAFDTAGVIARYEEVTRLDPGQFWDWIELGGLYVASGSGPEARMAAERAVALAQGDLARAIALRFAGQAALADGDLSAARASWEESLRLILGLERAEPQSRSLQRRRASTQGLLGSVLLRQGDLVEAISIYEASTDTLFDLAIESPTTVLQQELSVGLTRTADAYLALGAAESAMTPLRGALRIYRRQIEDEPDSVYIQRGLAVTLTKVGDANLALGDLAGARAALEESVALFRLLSAADRTSVRSHTDLIGGQERLGNVLIELGDLPRAKVLFEENLAIADLPVVTASNSSNIARLRANTLLRLGDVLLSEGDRAGALSRYQRSLEIRERLSAADPASAVLARDVFVSCVKIANLTGERRFWERALAVLRDLQARGTLAEADRPYIAQVAEILAGPGTPAN